MPFNIDNDNDMAIINKYIADVETSMFDCNKLLDLTLPKSAGVRVKFDIITIKSILKPEARMLLVFGPSLGGQELADSSRELAGTVAGKLWFKFGDAYVSAEEELDQRRALMERLAEPLKDTLQTLRKALEEMGSDNEGEEWKEKD